MQKKLMNAALIIAYTYVGFAAILYFMQRDFLYFPGGPRPALTVNAEPEILTVTPEDSIALDGLYWPAKDSFPTIVFFHGNGQAYQYWVDKLSHYREHGYGALFTDYRGYGGANGQPTEQGLYQDARSFLTALKDQKSVPPENMIFYGESLGTGVAVQMATEFTPKAMILESAYSATADIAKGRYWMFPVEFLMKDQYRSIDKIAALDMPKFFIHGEKDRIIPIKHALKLYEAAPEPKEFQTIPSAGHNNQYDHGAPLHIVSFLSKITSQEQ